MRIGKTPKKSRFWVKAGEYGDPQHISSETVIGQVSSDIISQVYAPRIIDDIANSQLEQYADDLLTYDNTMKKQQQQDGSGGSGEYEVGADGSVKDTAGEGPPPPPPERPLFYSQASINDFIETLEETSEHFFARKTPGWKVHANAAKFERVLDERYGILRPFITNHPQLEKTIRSIQRKYATGYFSPLRQSGPPIPRSTSIVILFLMKRGNVSWQIMTLAFLFFLVGLQPWALVLIVSIVQSLLIRRQHKPVGKMTSTSIEAIEPYYATAEDNAEQEQEEASKKKRAIMKEKLLMSKVGEPITSIENGINTDDYDTILIGYGPSCLYTAALLSRVGRKCLLLSPRSDASGCLTMEHLQQQQSSNSDSKNKGANKEVVEKFQTIPFDVESSNVPKITKQQQMMAPALSTTNDYQGGIRFAQIGSEADGHAFDILNIPDSNSNAADGGGNGSILFVLKGDGGLRTLMEDAATELGDGWPGAAATGSSSDGDAAVTAGVDVGSSTTGSFVNACQQINSTAGLFYVSKVLPDSVNNLRKDPLYGDTGVRYASTFLNKCFPTNTRTRSVMAAIGMKYENIKPSQTSMATHVTNVCSCISSTGEGMHYPIGGPRALARAFANVIEKSGGRIITGVDVRDLIFDEDETSAAAAAAATATSPTATGDNTDDQQQLPPPKCVGVRLSDGREIRFNKERYTNGGGDNQAQDEPAVVSFQGFIDTFVRLLPEQIRDKYKVPRGLPALSERRPVFKVLFALRGSADELSITGADYYRLPNASIAYDEIDPVTGMVKHGEIGGRDDDDLDPEEQPNVEDINKDPSSETSTGKHRSKRSSICSHRTKFHTGASWIHISFPSAKDPSFEQRHGKVSTCVVTIEADDDFVTGFDTKPKLFVVNKETGGTAGTRQRLLDGVTKDLFDTYPQLQGRVVHSEVRGPYQRGLSHNPERYAAKGIRADTPYPRLFVGGNDLTVGESFSAGIFGGWLVANAVVGYKFIDLLFLQKNITSDIEQFLEPPVLPDDDEDEDLAVPYNPVCL